MGSYICFTLRLVARYRIFPFVIIKSLLLKSKIHENTVYLKRNRGIPYCRSINGVDEVRKIGHPNTFRKLTVEKARPTAAQLQD